MSDLPSPEADAPLLEPEAWRMLERESLHFRFVQDPIFNLSEAEERALEILRGLGCEFGLLPRPDPTSFVALTLTLGQEAQRVELAVDSGNGHPRYWSFITRRTPFAERLKDWLDGAFGAERFDRSRHVSSRQYVWLSYEAPPGFGGLPAPRPPAGNGKAHESHLRSGLFNFDPKEQHVLGRLAAAASRLNEEPGVPLQFQVYPREARFGGIELMVGHGERQQPVRIYVKGFYPLTYHVVTENTPVGVRLKDYLDEALGADNLDAESSRLKGRHLSLIYSVRHPRHVLDRFEGA